MPKNNLQRIKQIVREKQHQEIQGTIVDGVTANRILQVRKALKPKNRKKYDRIINKSVIKASDIAWKIG